MFRSRMDKAIELEKNNTRPPQSPQPVQPAPQPGLAPASPAKSNIFTRGVNNVTSSIGSAIKDNVLPIVNKVGTALKDAYKQDAAIPEAPVAKKETVLQPPTQPVEPLPETYNPDLKKENNLYSGMDTVEKYTSDVLTGKERVAGVQDAQNQASRQSALERAGQMEEATAAAARSGLTPGSLGYQRIIDRAMSGVESNAITRQQGVSDMQRQGYQSSLQNAMGLETSARNLATGERDYKTGRADTGFNRANDMRLEGKTDTTAALTRAQALINGLPDANARAQMQAALNSGGPEAANALYNQAYQIGTKDAGKLSSQFSESDKATQNYNSQKKTLELTFPKGVDDPSTPENETGESDQSYQSRIQKMMQTQFANEQTLQNAPVKQGIEDLKVRDAIKELNKGTPLTSMDQAVLTQLTEQGQFGPPLTSQTLIDSAGTVNKAIAHGKSGQPIVNVNGTPVKILGDKVSVRTGIDAGFYDTMLHSDFLPVEVNGTKYFIATDTKTWYTKKPDSISKGSGDTARADTLNKYKQYIVADPTLGG